MNSTQTQCKPWEDMRLEEVGRLADVIQGGGGKLTPQAADQGDIRKPSGVGGEGK